MNKVANNWWKTFFNEDYLFFWGVKGALKHTKKEINFLQKHVPLKKNYEILDLCCGHGRHSLELARRGFNVTGLDYSKYELDLARIEANRFKLNINFKQGDARNFIFSKKFDVILNMFTSFGYGSREDDKKIIHNVSKNLKRGGVFFIDLLSLPWLWRNYTPYSEEKYDNSIITSDRSFDFVNSINTETRTIIRQGKKKVYQNALRVYSLSELIGLLKSEGLKAEKFWGSYKAKKYGLDSKRMLVLAKKI